MPKRTDLQTILIIGSGPIVIGQACEFDYSGTQACKALTRGGLPGRPGQLEPGDDHDRPGVRRPHLHRADDASRSLEQIIAARAARRAAADDRRPDRPEPRDRARRARRARTLRRRADRRQASRRSRRPRTASCSRRRCERIGLDLPRSGYARIARRGARRVRREIGLPLIIRPSLTLGGTGGGIADNRRGVRAPRRLGPRRRRRSHEVLIEESIAGWKEFELEVMRDAQGQRRHRLLDRELRPDGRAHRRLDHRGAGADADRQGVPDHARRRDRDHPRDRRRDRRLEHPVRRPSRRPAGWSSSR